MASWRESVAAALRGPAEAVLGVRPTAVRGGLALGLAYLVWERVVSLNVGLGRSMLPTLNSDPNAADVVVVNHLARYRGGIRAGDLVTLESPGSGDVVLKRVVGLEDDIVLTSVHNERNEAARTTIRVPYGHVWVEGDNPRMSRDSRSFGPVPLSSIKGRAVGTIYPRLRTLPATFEHVHSGPPRRLREAAATTASASAPPPPPPPAASS